MDNFFDDEDLNKLKNVTEGEEFFTTLVQKALTSKNSDFEFLRCWQDRV
jgi:hypothetical protein